MDFHLRPAAADLLREPLTCWLVTVAEDDGVRTHLADEFKQFLLYDRDQLARAQAVKLLTYAIGVPPTRADRPKIEAIVESVRGKNYGFRSLVHEVVASEVFRNK